MTSLQWVRIEDQMQLAGTPEGAVVSVYKCDHCDAWHWRVELEQDNAVFQGEADSVELACRLGEIGFAVALAYREHRQKHVRTPPTVN